MPRSRNAARYCGSMQDRARSYTSCTIRDQDEQLRAQQQAVAEDPIFAAIERHKTALRTPARTRMTMTMITGLMEAESYARLSCA